MSMVGKGSPFTTLAGILKSEPSSNLGNAARPPGMCEYTPAVYLQHSRDVEHIFLFPGQFPGTLQNSCSAFPSHAGRAERLFRRHLVPFKCKKGKRSVLHMREGTQVCRVTHAGP